MSYGCWAAQTCGISRFERRLLSDKAVAAHLPDAATRLFTKIPCGKAVATDCSVRELVAKDLTCAQALKAAARRKDCNTRRCCGSYRCVAVKSTV